MRQDLPNANPRNLKPFAFGAILLAVLAITAVPLIVEFKNEVSPFLALLKIDFGSQISGNSYFKTTAAVRFTIVTTQLSGDSISTTIETDDSHQSQLCDQVMLQIYSLANKHPSANSLSLKIKIVGRQDAVIKIEDLDAVRRYSGKEEYISSEHRSFIGGRLVSSGMIDKSSMTLVPPTKQANELVGKTYQDLVNVSPSGHFGYRFINDSQAECLMEGVPYGAICPYTIQGESVTIVTSCSTGVYKIIGDTLIGDDGLNLTRIGQ